MSRFIEKAQIQSVLNSSVIANMPGVTEFDLRTENYFIDLGVGSIDRTVIIDSVLERLAVDIPLFKLSEVGKISELVERIYHLQEG